MCGGAGARLWPFSRQTFPKQLLPVVGERSMLQETAARVTSADFAAPLIVTGDSHGPLAERQLREIGIEPAAILLEPEPRNTAAVAALAAEWALADGDDDLLLLLPSDHFILDRAAFVEAIRAGLTQAIDGGIVTLGVRPYEANTQYGYIEAEAAPSSDACLVIDFVEKPNAKAAARFCKSGNFYWNAGIFLARASTLLDEIAAFMPATHDAVAQAFAHRVLDGPFTRPDAQAFGRIESVSIDVGVMQKTKRAFVVPVDMGWSDLGSWSAVWSSSAKDSDNNVVIGDVLLVDTKNSLVRSDGSAVVVTIGLEDVVVVGTKDAVLVAPLRRSDEIKDVVKQLANAGRSCATSAAREPEPIVGTQWAHPLQADPIRVEEHYGNE